MMHAKLILYFFCLLASATLHAKCTCKPSSRMADYVIVGVGTAGAVVAKELTDDRKTSVIALHNGENLTEDPLIKFAKNAFITVASSLIGPPLYENGETTPQSNADNRELLWALALPEGGASSINAGAWCRGTNEVYAQWEAIAGANWSVSRILEIFKSLENYHGNTPNPTFRGFNGPISVLQVPNPSNVSQTFTQAIIQATGVPFVVDYNDPLTPIGASSQLQYTQSPDGVLRVSSATAFLNGAVMTPEGRGVDGRKLRVLFESTALRTIWEGNRAIGVEYLNNNGRIKRVFARKGVIVCAGLRSSVFLLHSGIGSKSLLTALNIPVIFDNPNVGQGLADQPGVPILFSSNPDDTPLDDSDIFVQIAWLPAPGGDPSVRQVRFAATNPIPGLTAALVDLVQPKSRGTITINSADPLAPPVVDLGALSDPSDLTLYQQAFQVYVNNINIQLQLIDPAYELILPDPGILGDVNLVTDYIKQMLNSNQSFQSHCRMAPENQGGVVDSTGRVYGVKNLFVADDSIVPLCMDGATMASAYLIGANIARLIKEGN